MKTMTKKEKMYQRIEKHGANLNRIFHTKFDNVTLCKKLFSLEHKAHKLAEDYCNGVIDSDQWDIEVFKIEKKLVLLLNMPKNAPSGVNAHPCFVNGDPRGYALKINDEWVRNNNIEIEKDWGGFGLLAPDFNE